MSERTAETVLAFPMHGQRKLASEGYRTRDGHLIEWFPRLTGGKVVVVSRPEPFPLATRYPRDAVAEGTQAVDTDVWRLPRPTDLKRWWVTSARRYPLVEVDGPTVVWNPFVFTAPSELLGDRRVAFDLLDDWTVHHAFASIRDDVARAYRQAFERADVVFANSEATLALAERHGRSDAVLMPNGCDPERFTPVSRAEGPLTVGYIGKIGKRVDAQLIAQVAGELPDWSFVLAGPVLDRGYRSLGRIPNVTLLGDVPYPRIPELLTTFDIGWVPHRVGTGEVGGDAIKIYEYHAAGLPVVTTPIIGAGRRGLGGVDVVAPGEHVAALTRIAAGRGRVPRVEPSLPAEATWGWKAGEMLRRLGAV